MIWAEPGVSPTRKPRREPRAIGMTDSRHSCRLGRSWRSFGAMTLRIMFAAGVDRISPRPNRPTATGTMPMPSPSSGMSKEYRKCPVMLSMPMVPSRSPKHAISKVRGSEVDDM